MPTEPAPHKPQEPYESLRDAMVAQMADHLLSLESSRNAAGQNTVLAVVDAQPDEARPVVTKLLKESFTSSTDLPGLEIVDRKTYETIERLIEAGFLKANEEFGQQFHKNAAFAQNLGSPKVKQHEQAKKAFSDARRKMEMSTLLVEGGFPVEALRPIGEAVELSLKASALLAENGHWAGGEELPLAFIRSHIVSAGLLPDDAVATVAGVREAVTKPQSISQEDSRTLIASARQLINHVEKAVNRAAGG